MHDLIFSPADLGPVIAAARQRGYVALDTEFVWTKTFYPALGIVQIALSEAEVHLVDAVAMVDVAPIAELLGDPGIIKVFHDPSGDLPILARCFGVRTRGVFDLRLAAGFCGMPSTLSLVDLANRLLGVQLAKTESRSDWLQRPLTEAQLAYAADDVRHMPAMYGKSRAALETHGNSAWAWEEMERYERDEVYRVDPPERVYTGIKGMGRLNPPQLAILRELAAWREQTARDTDTTRSRIVRDEVLLEVARLAPASVGRLRAVPGLWSKVVKRHGEALLEAVQRGCAVPPDDWPRLPTSPLSNRELRERCDGILGVVRERAAARSIDPALVASRGSVSAWILAAARGRQTNHPLTMGWRAELLGGAADAFLPAVGGAVACRPESSGASPG